MKRSALPFGLGIAALALCATAGLAQRDGRGLKPVANPGEVVATELAFARLARDKGQWTAFAQFATKDAVMFVPQAMRAQQWLKGKPNPAKPVAWEPAQVWSSCDGTVAVTKGPWTGADGSVGYFTTVWQRQKDDTYRWVLDQGDTLDTALAEPDLVQADIADCPRRSDGPFGGPPRDGKRGKYFPSPVAADGLSGSSNDGSLSWKATVAPDNSREFRVLLRKGETMTEILASRVAAPKAG